MNKEQYELLGLSETATDEEITAAYERLKAQYNEEKWQEGEAGNEAARKLDRIEVAYREITDERREKQKNTSGTSAFEEVAEKIRSGDISGAQTLLDNFNERDAEWHYLQSVVFYKKNWMNESKKQLEIAIQMDGENAKYRDAYEKLKTRTNYQQQPGNANGTSPNANTDEQMGGNWCVSCANFCYTFLCVNCLFNLCCNCH